MIAFLDDHREVRGAGPICRVLLASRARWPCSLRRSGEAFSAFDRPDHAHAARHADPAKDRRDASPRIEVGRVHQENFGVHGVREVWRQPGSTVVARCTVARPRRPTGLRGIMRGTEARTTIASR
jgi:hypothetical protein